MELRTTRLLLRQFREDDLDAYAAMCADPEVMRYLSADGDVLTREDAWRQMAMLLGHWQLRGFGMWAVEELRTGRLVGRVGLHYPESWPDRELGWALSRPFWGQGLATEAAVLPGNSRSIRVAERLGSKPAGVATVHGLEHVVYRLDATAAGSLMRGARRYAL